MAYGVVVAYDSVRKLVEFLGDTLGHGGAGYLLAKQALPTNENVIMNATKTSTDIADITPNSPPEVNNDNTTPQPTPSTPVEKPAAPATDPSPKTGDESNAALWIALLMLSGAALAGFGVNRKFNVN